MNLSKISIAATLSFALTLGLASCKKEKNFTAPKQENTALQSKMITSRMTLAQRVAQDASIMSNDLRVYYDDGDPSSDNFGCSGSGGNCAPEDIVIVAPNIKQLFSIVKTGQSNKIKDFISNNYASLKEDISPIALDAVVQNDYALSIRSGSGNYTCLLFTNKENGNIELVYPFGNK